MGSEMRSSLLLVIAALILHVQPAIAQQPVLRWITGDDLYAQCTTPRLEGNCIAYIEAVADVLGGGQPIFGGYRACMIPGINGYRLREIVVDYLEKIAAPRDITAAVYVTFALSDKFPCKSEP